MPSGRKFLPFHLTAKEKHNKKIRVKLHDMIKAIEKGSCPSSAMKGGGKYDYSKCSVNPVAVAKSRIKRMKI